MTDFVIVPRGPFSLERAADVVQRFPPLRHQPAAAGGVVRLGFISDVDLRPVAVSVRAESYGGVLHGTVGGTTNIEGARRQVARIFSLDHDASEYPEVARRDPLLASLMQQFAGLRPVSFTSPYECACWANISQRISTTQAAKIVAGLVASHGEEVVLEGSPIRVFPRPERMVEIREVPGLASVKVERLRGIALAALEGKLDAGALCRMPHDAALAALRELPGIGPFWASAILLRACGVADVFPDEPISIAALGALHALGDHPTPAAIAEITDRYRPFGMWIAFLLRVAVARGALGDIAGREMAIRDAAAGATRTPRGRRPVRRAASSTRRAAPAA